MSDLRNFSKQFIEEFIEMYQDLPCLWKIKSKDYSNRLLRVSAYEKLIIKLKEVEPNADKDMALKKINSLRTGFRRELKKVRSSTSSGAGSDEQYEPHLWYFNLLLFTSDQEIARDGKSNMMEDDSETKEEGGNSNIEIIDLDILETRSGTSCEKQVSGEKEKAPGGKKRKTQMHDINKDLAKAYAVLNETDDEFVTFGNNVAHQLRGMDRSQQIVAKKIINETLFFGEVNQLNLQTAVQFGNFVQNVKKTPTSYSDNLSSYSTPSTPLAAVIPPSNTEDAVEKQLWEL